MTGKLDASDPNAPTAPEDFAGTWVSEVRQTGQGPMKFEFRFEMNDRLEITGTPVGTAVGEAFHRRGPYRLKDGWLISPVMNEGQRVRIALQDEHLLLTIDETLAFRLRRR